MLRRLLLASSFLLLVACSSPEKQLVGHWTVDPAALATAPSPQAKTAMQDVAIDLKDDKTFLINTKMVKMSGTYTLTDHAVDLKVTTVNDKPIASLGAIASSMQDVKANLAADGKKLSLLPTGGQTKQLDFVKPN